MCVTEGDYLSTMRIKDVRIALICKVLQIKHELLFGYINLIWGKKSYFTLQIGKPIIWDGGRLRDGFAIPFLFLSYSFHFLARPLIEIWPKVLQLILYLQVVLMENSRFKFSLPIVVNNNNNKASIHTKMRSISLEHSLLRTKLY